MSLKPVTDQLFILPGFVNMYLLDAPEGLTLIDAGLPNSEAKVLGALASLKRSPTDLKHVILTHAHPDHIGGLAAIVRASGARTYMHALDAPIAERGGGFRPMTPAPGFLPGLLFKLIIRTDTKVEPARIDQHVTDGEVIPIAGGLKVIHTPGHCAGHIALLWMDKGVLFAGDVCVNMFGLGPPIGYEDQAQGEASQCKLAEFAFDTACFGHGKPMRGDAARRFREFAQRRC